MDIQRHHRVLFGQDVVASLQIPMHLHRAQLEYELREKLILLRQQMLLAAGNKQRLWEILLRSLPAFTTLFRSAPAPRAVGVRAAGETHPAAAANAAGGGQQAAPVGNTAAFAASVHYTV